MNENTVTLALPGRYCHVDEIRLLPMSDNHNNCLQVIPWTQRYHKNTSMRIAGRVFIVRAPLEKRSLVIVIEAPDIADCGITMYTDRVKLDPCGCTYFKKECPAGTEEAELRAYFRARMPMPLFAMVNNWGDRHQGVNVCEEFCLAEIDAAADLGLDVVQIDDGWQSTPPGDVRIFDAEGNYTFYHAFDGSFWDVNTKKFPNGLEPLAKRAKERGIRLGLWFAPDSRGDFANFERDLAVLKNAYDMGFRYFKLDMVNLLHMSERDRFLEFLRAVQAFGDDIYLQIDVTGGTPRLGFTDGTSFGKLFVENRYTLNRDYLPFATLSALWQLSRYMPAQRFQFELPNRRMYTDSYDADDPLSPMHYTSDWQLASLLVCCPLFWMEIQHFDPEDAKTVKPLLDIWKRERDALAACDIRPVGALPDGIAMTGFAADGDGYGYAVALSEVTDEKELRFSMAKPVQSFEILYTNTKAEVSVSGCAVTVTLPDPRAYAFIRFTC